MGLLDGVSLAAGLAAGAFVERGFDTVLGVAMGLSAGGFLAAAVPLADRGCFAV